MKTVADATSRAADVLMRNPPFVMEVWSNSSRLFSAEGLSSCGCIEAA